jgi:hypothetical protein
MLQIIYAIYETILDPKLKSRHEEMEIRGKKLHDFDVTFFDQQPD